MPGTVLLVDDDVVGRRVLRTALVDAGFDVVDEAGDGMHAIALAAVHEPAVVVLDQMMPILDGRDAIAAILGVSPRSKVIVYSAVDGADLAGDVLRDGAVAFVSKLDDLQLLVRAVDRATEDHRSGDGSRG